MKGHWPYKIATGVISLGLAGFAIYTFTPRHGDSPMHPEGEVLKNAPSHFTPSAAAIASKAQTSSSPAPVTPEAFKQRANEVLNSLPTTEALHELTEDEVHRTPGIISKAGAELGAIAQAIHDHPELEPQGYEFYEICASRAQIPTSIRALCLSNLRRLAGRLGQTIDLSKYPASVRELSEQVPPNPVGTN